VKRIKIFGGNNEKDPPVPIPNTAVKLLGAENTGAWRPGKIGRCRNYTNPVSLKVTGFFILKRKPASKRDAGTL
jgi:hypothetical protein